MKLAPEHLARLTVLLRRRITAGARIEDAVEAVVIADRRARRSAPLPPSTFDRTPVSRIVEAVCSSCGVTADQFYSAARHAELVRARWVAAALMRALDMSLLQIGRHLNRHHTTLIDGLRRLDGDRKLLLLVNQLRDELADLFADGAGSGEEAA